MDTVSRMRRTRRAGTADHSISGKLAWRGSESHHAERRGWWYHPPPPTKCHRPRRYLPMVAVKTEMADFLVGDARATLGW